MLYQHLKKQRFLLNMMNRSLAKKRKQEQKKIAKERIEILFKQAKDQFKEDPSLSDRYVKLARDIAMKTRTRIPKELKRRFCKHCYSYLVPDKNCRVRLQKQKVVYFCEKCRRFMRYPYIKEIKAKRKAKEEQRKIKKEQEKTKTAKITKKVKKYKS